MVSTPSSPINMISLSIHGCVYRVHCSCLRFWRSGTLRWSWRFSRPKPVRVRIMNGWRRLSENMKTPSDGTRKPPGNGWWQLQKMPTSSRSSAFFLFLFLFLNTYDTFLFILALLANAYIQLSWCCFIFSLWLQCSDWCPLLCTVFENI